jgi:two-component system, LytTR family, sensor kinase
VLLFIAIVAIVHAVDYYRKYRERELRLAQARLHSLKAQLHPHFLFNTLNAVSELVYKDPEAAEKTIIDLSDLLRSSLDSGDAQLVSLKEELDFLRRYVDIHQTLMRDRLTVVIKIDPETLGASVPSMILQPLVENAIRHGADPASRAGRIEISAARDCNALRLTVSDAGPGLPEQGQTISRKGIGLANTQARLAELYGNSHRFELKNSPGPGLTVNIFIPFEERRGSG